MIKLLVLIFIIIFIIVIPIYYLFSRTIYSPINRIVKYVKGNLVVKDVHAKYDNDNKNELDYLTSAFKSLSTEVSMKNLSVKDRFFIKQKILKDYLLNSTMIESELVDLDINLDPENLLVFVLRIDHFSKSTAIYSKKDFELINYALMNISQEIVSSNFNCEAVDMETDHIALILNICKEPLSHATLLITEDIKKIQNTFIKSFDISVTAGIGNFAASISNVPDSYKWAYEYTNYKIIFGPGSILCYDNVSYGQKRDFRYHDEKEKILFDAIKAESLSKIEAALSNILNEFLKYQYSDILVCILTLYLNSEKLLNYLKRVTHEEVPISLNLLKENIEKFETISEIKEWFMDTYRLAVIQMQEPKLHKRENMINRVITYIEENYNSPSLSPEYLADHVNLSPNYLRAIFKEDQKISLTSFINNFRFEKAKYLLESTSLSISDVSQEIGIANTNYFYTSFKKYYGISPAEWRRNQMSVGKK